MSGHHVECTAAFTPDPGDVLLINPELRSWLATIPDGAHISAIIKDFGSQRDPDLKTVGLVAKWSDVKPAKPARCYDVECINGDHDDSVKHFNGTEVW